MMISLKFVKTYLLAFFFMALLFACENSREEEAREEMQEVEAWLDEKSQQTEEWTEQEWQHVKTEFREFESEIEEDMGALSDESRERFNEIKDRYKTWEGEVENEIEEIKREEEIMATNEWKNKLLGQYADSASITSDNVREVYITFMENVRTQHEAWRDTDWEKAERVYELLNDRKDGVDDEISAGDAVKIKALQAEFLSLKAAGEVEEAIEG